MRRWISALAASLLLALTGGAPAASAAPPVAPAATVRVVMTTQAGAITLELDAAHAPVTTANFLRYVDQRRFDGTVFYRVMRLAWGQQPNGLIQAGTRGDPRRVLKPIVHEPTSQTGVLHKAGAISMARFAPGTATGDFSILVSDMPGLDADPASADPELKAGYAAFGHVTDGMDVVRAIYQSPLSPTKGEGALKGQMLERELRIISVRRVPLTAPPTTPAPPRSPAAGQ
jgi:peptidyl-prolyl cis-trans isomerase A (cyclophilin A)